MELIIKHYVNKNIFIINYQIIILTGSGQFKFLEDIKDDYFKFKF